MKKVRIKVYEEVKSNTLLSDLSGGGVIVNESGKTYIVTTI